MPALNALSSQSAESRQVLRQPHRRDDSRQFTRAARADQSQVSPRAWVALSGASGDTHCQGKLKGANKFPILTSAPGREAGIASVSRGKAVRAGFRSAPVVAGGNHHRVHAVHNPFVVRGRTVGVRRGKCPRLQDAIAHLLACVGIKSQHLGW